MKLSDGAVKYHLHAGRAALRGLDRGGMNDDRAASIRSTTSCVAASAMAHRPAPTPTPCSMTSDRASASRRNQRRAVVQRRDSRRRAVVIVLLALVFAGGGGHRIGAHAARQWRTKSGPCRGDHDGAATDRHDGRRQRFRRDRAPTTPLPPRPPTPARRRPAPVPCPRPFPPQRRRHPTQQSYSSAGGSIVVNFDGSTVSLASSSPAAGFTAEVHDNGPSRVEVRFTNGATEWRIRVDVENGALVAGDHPALTLAAKPRARFGACSLD